MKTNKQFSLHESLHKIKREDKKQVKREELNQLRKRSLRFIRLRKMLKMILIKQFLFTNFLKQNVFTIKYTNIDFYFSFDVS